MRLRLRKGVSKGFWTTIAVAIIVAIVVGIVTYYVSPRGVPVTEYNKLKTEYEKLKAEYEKLKTQAGVNVTYYKQLLEKMKQYEIFDPAHIPAFTIFLKGRVKTGWWVNAPVIRQYYKKPPYTIGFITSWRGNPWQETAIAEFKREAERWMKAGLLKSYIHRDSAGSVDTERAILEEFYSMCKAGKLDGIIVDPLDPVALNDIIEKIYDSGCPIILWNDAVNTTKYTAYVGPDDATGWIMGAEWLAKQLNYSGKILFFRGLKGYPIDYIRSDNALAVFKKYPGIKIVDIVYGDWSYDKAKKLFMELISAHPDIDGIFTVGGQMASAIIDAMIELGMDPSKYPIVGEDQNGFMMRCTKYNIKCFAPCHPSISSAIALDLMIMLLQGYPVPKFYYYSSPVITPDEIPKYVRPNAPEGIFVFTPLSDEELNKIIKGG